MQHVLTHAVAIPAILCLFHLPRESSYISVTKPLSLSAVLAIHETY